MTTAEPQRDEVHGRVAPGEVHGRIAPGEVHGREAVRIVPAGPVRGQVTAPASKSLTNRLLVLGALGEGTSRLARPLVSDDTEAMAAGLRTLGIPAHLGATEAVVEGRGGRVGPPSGVVEAGLSGTTLRFLAAVSLLAGVPVALDGAPPLRRRPLAPLLAALEAAGAKVDSASGHAPVVIEAAGLAGGPLRVDASASSQFATALLLVAPYARADLELEVAGLGAGGYVEMTLDAMRRFGAEVEVRPGGHVRVSCSHHYRARDEEVAYDASAAAHLFSLAVATGGSVQVDNAVADLQPDGAIVEVFAAMGAEVTTSRAGGTTVRASSAPLRAVAVDLRRMPDQVATVAVLAALAEGTTHLSGLEVVRGHETDRIEAVASELAKLGGDLSTHPDGLTIRGGRPLHGGLVETYDDHRMAMAFTALGAAVPGVEIARPGCVAKTYPCWWRDVASLGVGLA